MSTEPTLAVRRITREEIDAALFRDRLRRRAEQGDRAALTSLMGSWPDYARDIVARALHREGNAW